MKHAVTLIEVEVGVAVSSQKAIMENTILEVEEEAIVAVHPVASMATHKEISSNTSTINSRINGREVAEVKQHSNPEHLVIMASNLKAI